MLKHLNKITWKVTKPSVVLGKSKFNLKRQNKIYAL